MSNWKVEFFDEAVESEFNSFSPEVKAKTVHITQMITEFGLPNIGMPYIKHLQGKIWEMRALQGRSLYITVTGQKILILRCFVKKSNKTPQKELKIAQKRAREVQDG
jgi:phage-related protein